MFVSGPTNGRMCVLPDTLDLPEHFLLLLLQLFTIIIIILFLPQGRAQVPGPFPAADLPHGHGLAHDQVEM